MPILQAFNDIESKSLPFKPDNFLLDGLGIGQQLHGDIRIGTKDSGYILIDGQNVRITIVDSSGNEVLTEDLTGITIRDGKLTIEDDSGTTIVDGTGLVSENNFLINSDSFTGDQSFTSTNYADLADIDLTTVIQRPTRVLFLLSAEVSHEQTTGGSDMNGRAIYDVKIDSTHQEPPISIDTSLVDATGVKENVFRKTYFTAVVMTLSAGSYPATVHAYVSYKFSSNTNATGHIYKVFLTRLVLGS